MATDHPSGSPTRGTIWTKAWWILLIGLYVLSLPLWAVFASGLSFGVGDYRATHPDEPVSFATTMTLLLVTFYPVWGAVLAWVVGMMLGRRQARWRTSLAGLAATLLLFAIATAGALVWEWFRV